MIYDIHNGLHNALHCITHVGHVYIMFVLYINTYLQDFREPVTGTATHTQVDAMLSYLTTCPR